MLDDTRGYCVHSRDSRNSGLESEYTRQWWYPEGHLEGNTALNACTPASTLRGTYQTSNARDRTEVKPYKLSLRLSH